MQVTGTIHLGWRVLWKFRLRNFVIWHSANGGADRQETPWPLWSNTNVQTLWWNTMVKHILVKHDVSWNVLKVSTNGCLPAWPFLIAGACDFAAVLCDFLPILFCKESLRLYKPMHVQKKHEHNSIVKSIRDICYKLFKTLWLVEFIINLRECHLESSNDDSVAINWGLPPSNPLEPGLTWNSEPKNKNTWQKRKLRYVRFQTKWATSNDWHIISYDITWYDIISQRPHIKILENNINRT